MIIKKWLHQLRGSISEHPGTWLLFGLFLIAEHGNYTIGSNLHQVCDLLDGDDVEICIDGDCNIMAEPDEKTKYRQTIKEKIDDICYGYENDDPNPDP